MNAGLYFPEDPDAWQSWQDGRQSLPRRIRNRLTSRPPMPVLTVATDDVDALAHGFSARSFVTVPTRPSTD